MPPKVIPVPKTDASAYNPRRPAGLLLQAQAAHMREALIKHVHELTTLINVDMKSLKTEADVSAYVHQATALLHPHAAKPPKK